MSKPQISEKIAGKYRLKRPLFPGLFEFPGVGKINFRTCSVKDVERLRKATGDRYVEKIAPQKDTGSTKAKKDT